MPNWCSNTLTIKHDDPAMLQRIRDAIPTENLFGAFFPTPPELLEEVPVGEDFMERSKKREQENLEKFGYTDWYNWNIQNWGTKWDTSVLTLNDDQPDMLNISFDTAWGPPGVFFEKMTDLGFDIEAHYLEEGMGFVGKYTSEDGDESYNFDGSEDLEDIPDDICEHWDLAGLCEMREESSDDFDDSDYEDDEDAEEDVENPDDGA